MRSHKVVRPPRPSPLPQQTGGEGAVGEPTTYVRTRLSGPLTLALSPSRLGEREPSPGRFGTPGAPETRSILVMKGDFRYNARHVLLPPFRADRCHCAPGTGGCRCHGRATCERPRSNNVGREVSYIFGSHFIKCLSQMELRAFHTPPGVCGRPLSKGRGRPGRDLGTRQGSTYNHLLSTPCRGPRQ